MDETCYMRADGQHCNCWFDGAACCACGAPAMSEAEKKEAGMSSHEEGVVRD